MNIIDVNRSKLNCALIDNSNHRKLKFKVVSNSEEGFVTLRPLRDQLTWSVKF